MCKSTQLVSQSASLTSAACPPQASALHSAPSGLQVKNTFLQSACEVESSCDSGDSGVRAGFRSAQKRAMSEPSRSRCGSDDVASSSTSEPSHDDLNDSDVETVSSTEPGRDQSDSNLDLWMLPAAEDSDHQWPSTPESSPRAVSDVAVPSDSVFQSISCVSKLITIIESHNVDALLETARACVPSDARFLVSTPEWSNEFEGHAAVDTFLRQFVSVFPDLSMNLENVIHPQEPNDPMRWRAACSATQQLPFLASLPVGSRIQFTWDTTKVKNVDGKTTFMHWKFSPASEIPSFSLPGQHSQQMFGGMMQMYVPAMQIIPVMPLAAVLGNMQSSQFAAGQQVQAARSQLAVASLRAQMTLEAQESMQSAGKPQDSQQTLKAQTTSLHGGQMNEAYESRHDAELTTVILRNIPVEYTRQMFLDMLDSAGFAGKYNFVYMPRDFQRSFGLGYCFVNMETHEDAAQIHDAFHGFHNWEIPSQKICQVGWSSRHQGLTEQINRYRNSGIMHESVPDEYKPVLFCNGARIEFPAPTHKLNPPPGLHA